MKQNEDKKASGQRMSFDDFIRRTKEGAAWFTKKQEDIRSKLVPFPAEGMEKNQSDSGQPMQSELMLTEPKHNANVYCVYSKIDDYKDDYIAKTGKEPEMYPGSIFFGDKDMTEKQGVFWLDGLGGFRYFNDKKFSITPEETLMEKNQSDSSQPMEIEIKKGEDFLTSLAFNGLTLPAPVDGFDQFKVEEFCIFADGLVDKVQIIVDNFHTICRRPPKLGEVFRALNKEKHRYIDGAEKEERDLALKWSKENITKYRQEYKEKEGDYPIYVPLHLFSALIPNVLRDGDMSVSGVYWHELIGGVRWYAGEEPPVEKDPVEPKENTMKTYQSDTVHPARYNQYSLEAWDMLERMYGTKTTALWCEMTAMKYRLRLGHKDEISKELEKEKIYLAKAKELRNKESGVYPESLL